MTQLEQATSEPRAAIRPPPIAPAASPPLPLNVDSTKATVESVIEAPQIPFPSKRESETMTSSFEPSTRRPSRVPPEIRRLAIVTRRASRMVSVASSPAGAAGERMPSRWGSEPRSTTPSRRTITSSKHSPRTSIVSSCADCWSASLMLCPERQSTVTVQVTGVGWAAASGAKSTATTTGRHRTPKRMAGLATSFYGRVAACVAPGRRGKPTPVESTKMARA